MKSKYFIYDGINSIDKGLYVLSIDGGLHSDTLSGAKTIIEQRVGKRSNPLLNRVENQPIEFQVTFSLIDGQWSPEKREDIARWLLGNKYKPFQTYDDLGKYYYAMVINPWVLDYDATDKGYMTLNFRCDAYHAWSPIYYQTYDLRNNDTTTNITIDNRCNTEEYFYPKIEFTLQGNSTAVTIKNLSDAGREFKFTDLNLEETVSVDNERKIIVSDLASVYRLKDFNKNWLRLVYGENNVEVTGKCILKVKAQFPLIR